MRSITVKQHICAQVPKRVQASITFYCGIPQLFTRLQLEKIWEHLSIIIATFVAAKNIQVVVKKRVTIVEVVLAAESGICFKTAIIAVI